MKAPGKSKKHDALQPNADSLSTDPTKKLSTQPAFPVPLGMPPDATPPTPKNRTTLTLRFDPDMLDRARNACHASNKTFQQMIDYALWNMTRALEAWNGGKPYPPRTGNLKTGPKSKNRKQ